MSFDQTISAEQLAYWYLRLNGFLTITNFVVHPDTGRNQETDVDILGVRFPFRAENLQRPMKDEPLFAKVRDKTLIVFAEVKNGRCGLNGPWTNPERQNMIRVLSAVGAFPKAEVSIAADSIYQSGRYESQLYHVTLLCFGNEPNKDIAKSYKAVPQIMWDDVGRFIYRRFEKYKNQKISHQQWGDAGHYLWDTFVASNNEDDYLLHFLPKCVQFSR